MAPRCVQIILFCFLYSTSAFATPGIPAPHVIDTDSLDYVEMPDSAWQMLEDPDGTLTIYQVAMSSLSEKFHEGLTYPNGVGFSVHTYWMRFRLKNGMDRVANIFIYPQYADKIDYYFSNSNGKWDHETSGYLYPDDSKNIFHSNYNVPLSIDPAREVTVYVRLYINYFYYNSYKRPQTLRAAYGSQEKYIDSYNQGSLFPAVQEAVFFGILTIAVIYNLLFFWIVRERLYLYFSLFLFCFAMYSCESFLFSTNLSHRYPPLLYYTSNLWGPIYLFFGVSFIRHYFKVWRHTPRWDNYLVGIAFFQLAIRIISVFVGRILPSQQSDFIWKIDMINSYVINFSILITFFLFTRKRTPYTKLLLLATLPLILYLAIIRSTTFAIEVFNVTYNGKFFEVVLWLKRWSAFFYLISISWLVIIFTLILFNRYKNLQQENVRQAIEKEKLAREKEEQRNELIAKQKVELEQQVKARTSELKQSLEELRATQTQLIHAEKMASLGELTAGIAHEIQNPLNFVNNFSEVNTELLAEIREEIEKGNFEEVKTLASDVMENQGKINSHGKRADAIVKSMLQHSRVSSAKKEVTDINALADEYLRLSYHGLRAKDKTFSARFKAEFDPTIERMRVVGQDIGRVILNLINNAFYAVSEKAKLSVHGYEPLVIVTTRKLDGKVEIKVKDNGNGIPKNIVDKIFQPFFTTKPTGQGTGLGLSLSYDIVKAHGGDLKVKTIEGEGSEFTIEIPTTQ